jgi:hypothetical protein
MKRSSTSMIYWLNSIENWTQLNTNTEWKAQDRHRKKLKKYTFSLIIALDKFHETIINRSIENHEQIKTHIDKMIDFMSTVSLMRICKHLTFIDDESLINVSSTMHIKITVQLFSQYDTVINESMNAHKKAMKRIYESKLTAWKRHNKLDEKSKVKIQEYLARIRILQVLSFFSRLLQLKTMKHLLLINEYSKEQRWIKIHSMILYKMIDNLANSFQRHIREICDHNHCFKIVIINKLIEKWDFKKKTMFCSMSSMQAEILYHVSDHVICCAACLATWRWMWQEYFTLSMLTSSVKYFIIMKKILCILITSFLRKNQLHKIMRLFQEESTVTFKFIASKIESSWYIIDTISVIKQELTLTKTCYLVQLNSKWMMSTQNQTKKRIWCIMQTRLIITYNIICMSFNIEKVIDNRQFHRWSLFNKMLESQKLNIHDLT